MRETALFLAAVRDQAPDVLFIDTLARSFGAGDENSTSDMNLVVANISALVQETGAAVILVHHSGKAKDQGMRGSNALLAGVDQVLKIDHEEGQHQTHQQTQRWMQVTHSRDGEAGAIYSFGLTPMIIGQDEEGEPLFSCTVTHHLRIIWRVWHI